MKPMANYAGYWRWGIACFLLLATGHLLLGELNQDEGWYLYAARLTAEGRRPYADFAFTQGPLFPHIYAWADPLVRWGGLAAGRAFTSALGLLAMLLSALAARRMAPAERGGAAATATWLLLSLNSYQIYFLTIVKTYALASCFLALTMVAWSHLRGSRGGWWAAISGFTCAAAVAVRLSAAATGFALLAWLLLKRRRVSRWALPGFIAGGLIGGILFFGPPWLYAQEGLCFGLFEYHAGRIAGEGGIGWLYRAGFLARMLLAWWPLMGATAVCFWLESPTLEKREANPDVPEADAWLWAAAAMTLVHAAAPFPYDDYQVLVFPMLAVWLSLRWMTRIRAEKNETPRAIRRRLTWLMLIGLIAVASSPIHQGWVVLRRDRIWWRMKSEPDLIRLRRTAAWLAERIPPDAPLLTQDLYLAIEANRRVPDGLEMGPFSYYPDMDDTRAERLHVLNRHRLRALIRRAEAPWAAFSGYGLSIAAPRIDEVPPAEQARLQQELETVYEWVREVPDFGQGHTTLRIYRRRP